VTRGVNRLNKEEIDDEAMQVAIDELRSRLEEEEARRVEEEVRKAEEEEVRRAEEEVRKAEEEEVRRAEEEVRKAEEEEVRRVEEEVRLAEEERRKLEAPVGDGDGVGENAEVAPEAPG
jgi:membrane protein involved in colicin uptake